MASKLQPKKVEQIVVEPIQVRYFTVTVEGVDGSSMLMNKMSAEVEEKLKKLWETGARRTPKELKKKLAKEIIEEKIHVTKGGKVGFPAAGFKKGMTEVAPKCGLYKNDVKGAVFVVGDIIPIKFDKKEINECWARTKTGVPKPTIRPEFTKWSCELLIKYNAAVFTAERICNLLNWAGFHQGLGDWRPSSGGIYGQYRVKGATKDKAAQY